MCSGPAPDIRRGPRRSARSFPRVRGPKFETTAPHSAARTDARITFSAPHRAVTHLHILTRAGQESPAFWRRHPAIPRSGGPSAPSGAAGIQSHSASTPRSAPRTPPPVRCRPGNSVFRRFRPRAAGRGNGTRNFPKWSGRVRRPPAPLSLPPHRRPRLSGRPGTARVPAAVGPSPGPQGLCDPAAPHSRGPRPHPRANGGAGQRRDSRPTLTRNSTRRLARRARRPLSPELLVTRSGRRQLSRRSRGRRSAPSGPAAASPRACAQRPLPTNDRKNHRGTPGAGEEGLGE